MSDVGFLAWTLVIFLFAFMCFSSFELGGQVTQIIFRLSSRHRWDSYDRWGVTADLFRPRSRRWFAATVALFTVNTLFFGLLAFGSTALLIEESLPTRDQFYQTLTFAMYALFMGLMMESERINRVTEKTRKLDDLREVFHERFKESELLSVYESLRSAPPLFWDEYANLPDNEISEETNRSYRERAAPYSNMQFGKYDRIIIAVAVLTLLLTGVSAAIQLLP